MSNAHSRCSPSSLKRRARCPASCFEESGILEAHDTNASDEGTKLHRYMEKLLHGTLKFEHLPEAARRLCKDAWEMMEFALGDEVKNGGKTVNGGEWFTEVRLPCSSSAAEGYEDWGTVDLIVVYRKEMRAVIMDWKFGASLVDAPLFNYQLKDYAVNLRDSGVCGVDMDWIIELGYIQPLAREMYNFQPASLSPEDLELAATENKAVRTRAYQEHDEYRIGQHCQFCKAKAAGTCWARGAFLSQFVAGDPIASLDGLSPIQLGEILSTVKVVAGEAKRIQELVRVDMAAGKAIPGFTYNPKVNRISGSPSSRGMKAPDIVIRRTCANRH